MDIVEYNKSFKMTAKKRRHFNSAVRCTMTQLPIIEYDLIQLRDDIIALMVLMPDKRQREISWIETAHSQVTYSDPQITSEVRQSTRNLSSALCVLYFVTTIEAYLPNTYKDPSGMQRNLWDELQLYGWLWSSELDRLRAYRHVRHSFAHNPGGTHAHNNRTSFDKIMSSANPLPLITSDGTKITVDSGASILMVNEIHPILQNVLARMMSSPEFGAKPPQ